MKVQNHSLFFMCKTMLFLALFITLGSFAHAFTIKELSIQDIIRETDVVSEMMSLHIVNNSETSLVISIPEGASNFTINGIAKEVSNSSVNISLNCVSCSLNFTYILYDSIRKDVELILSRTINAPSKPEILKYWIVLPPGFVVSSSTSEPALIPKPTSITTDSSKIIVFWNDTNPDLPKKFEVRFLGHEELESYNLSMANEIREWPVWIWMSLTLAVGFFAGAYMRGVYQKGVYQKNGKDAIKKLIYAVPSSLLSPDEKNVVRLLMRNKNKMNQKEIVRSLNWSKSKVSAVVSNLQYKKIIKKEKFGRNYSVELLSAIDEE
jgi:hypothetical protein